MSDIRGATPFTPAVIGLLLLAVVLAGRVSGAALDEEKVVSELKALFDAEWEHEMQTNPTWASSLGDRRWNDRWEDLSLAAVKREHEHDVDVLGRLTKIPRSSLPPEEQLNYALFRRRYEMRVEGFRFGDYLIPLTQRDGIQTADETADSLRFETVKDYEDWLARLRAFDVHMDQTIALMREGMRRRVVQPQVTMRRVPGQIEKQLVSEPTTSPFYKPFRQFAAGIAEPEQQRLASEAQAAVREVVLPSFRRLERFFADEYLPACFDEVGAWQWPDGEAAYTYLARKFTTTNLTPRQIHEIGLSEVARIRGEMKKAKDRAGFKGSLPEFFKFLRTDPQFYCTSPAELLAEYRSVSKRIDPLLVKVFRTLPRMPYGLEAIPDMIAPDTTTAYYRPPAADGSRAGTYFVNLYKPEARPRWEMMALSLHEAVPGHHLQIALSQEQGELPPFRRYAGYTAYIEGWGLYAESLGDELGLYNDPYDKFGQLTYEMWRAVRLVVDTGIHSLRWNRKQAIDFFRENAPKADQDIVNEVDRYISWPGQALAYKIGQLKIRELRTRSERELGDKFDLKAFHDTILL
ncbi:MAG TPA: DUF885 domain-containing protein, partial [Pirellulales bacterium]|nr:DUF885 domain-containing protein [Pirellulales bacterium]